ncbi:MAG: flagellar motor switch protein FliG [Balneolaceae bacterium]|jgi:flagellar motor switch protein FliG
MTEGKNLIEDASRLSGTQKVAVLLISLGVDQASTVLKELKDEEVEKVTLEIANMDNISPEVVDEVIREFHSLMHSKRFILEGGMEYARNVLTETKGRQEVRGMMKRLESKTGNDTFGLFQSAETSHIVQFLQNEHPQIAAVILAHLKESRAAEILSHLDADFQGEVSLRLARMGNISSDVIEEIEEVIRDQISTTYTQSENIRKGSSAVANILNEADIATERMVLGNIEKLDQKLAEEIKNQMFLFEDIVDLDDRDVQTIIGVIDRSDLVVGLKGVDEQLVQKVLDNMSSRAKDMFLEDMEATGQVHKKQVEEAQQRIVIEIKNLEDEGQISTRKASEEEMVE